VLGVRSPLLRTSLRLSVVAAMLAVIGNVIALRVERIYAALTPTFLTEAIAQDVVNLMIVSPLWLVLTVLALRGSMRAYLIWIGVSTFTAYNYVIYAFAIPFGPLFLLWVSVLGLSLYSLIGAITAIDCKVVQLCFPNRSAVQVAAWFLMITAVLFSLLWLSEDVPALVTGKTPQSLIDLALPTNPVHILDLAFFLPAAIVTGALLIKRRAFGFVVAPAFSVFLILVGLPILLTPVIQAVRGQEANWGITVPIGILTVFSAAVLAPAYSPQFSALMIRRAAVPTSQPS